MKKFVFICFGVLFSALLSAQDRAFECLKDIPSDSQLLSRIQLQYDNVKSLRAEFDQISFMAALDERDISSGTVWYKRPGKMRWHYRVPEEQIFITKDKSLWLYQPVSNQVIVDAFEDVLVSDLPVSFLLGLGDLKKDFTVKSACETSEGIAINLLPVNPDKNLGKFSLLVSRTSYFPVGAKITDIGGNETIIVFNNSSINEEIGDKLFDPSFPKGTDIDDRRNELKEQDLPLK